MARSTARPKASRGPNSAKRSRALTADERKLWRSAFDPEEWSIKDFLELFMVQTKSFQKSTGSVLMPFEERAAQVRLREAIEAEWAAGRGAKIVVLKDRQQGISEWVCRFFVERMLRGGGGHARQISHKDQATEDLLQRARLVKDQLTEEKLGLLDAVIESERADRGFSIRFGTHLVSSLEILTARDDALGRGGAVRWIHLSEYPWWKAGKDKLEGLLDSWEDAPGNCVIFESTGRTYDEFYDLCVNAKEEKNGYVFLFFSWLTHPTKTLGFPSNKARADFIKSVGRVKRYAPEEEITLRDQLGATFEQLRWRRRKIDTPQYNGDIPKFRREHPSVWTDSFLSISLTLYDPNILRAWLPLGERMDLECKIGDLSINEAQEVTFDEHDRGYWRIYKMPEVGVAYTWGADPAEGREVIADGRTSGDLSVIQVREVISKRIVAVCSGYIDPENFGVEVIKASVFYGGCMGFVEANNHGGTVILTIRNMEYEEILLTRNRLTPTDSGKVWTRAPGFLSKSDTKPVAVNRSRKWVRDLGMPDKDSEPMLPSSLIHQMMRYVRIDKRGRKMGAATGHDDEVSADYICHEAIARVEAMLDKAPKVEHPLTDFERYVLREPVASDVMQGDRDLGPGF